MLVTNSSWVASASSTEHTGAWKWANYGGEIVNHSKSQLDWATATTTTPAAGWAAATEYNDAPNIALTPEAIESVENVETMEAVEITECPLPPPPTPPHPPPPPPPPPPHSDCPASSGFLGGARGECGSAPTGKCGASSNITLACKHGSGGVIQKLDFVDWGLPSGTCGHFKPGYCNSSKDAYDVVAAACLGKPSCSIRPCGIKGEGCPFAAIQDPCPGMSKVLAIQASGCAPAAEHDADGEALRLPLPSHQGVSSLPRAPRTVARSSYKIKMSRLFNGWLDVKDLPAVSGSTVQLEYSGHVETAQEWAAMDSVVVQPSVPGGADFSNRFNWHEFQYVTVTGSFTSAPQLSSFTGRRLMNAMPRVGAFSSSNPMLDKIYAGFRETNEGLTISGMLVDCPNRERLGYVMSHSVV